MLTHPLIFFGGKEEGGGGKEEIVEMLWPIGP